jgi:hypothetical protein
VLCLIIFVKELNLHIFSIIIEPKGIVIFARESITSIIDFYLEFIVFIDLIYHFLLFLPLIISRDLHCHFKDHHLPSLVLYFLRLALQLYF